MPEQMLLDADRVMRKMNQWNAEDSNRASSAAETRQDIGQFVEDTGYHKKAISDGRKLLKMAEDDPDKLWDYLRTFEPLLNDLKEHVRSANTPDMFDQDEDAPEAVDGDTVLPFNGEFDEETAEFDAAADEALSAAE
jgi:hypothetical protein